MKAPKAIIFGSYLPSLINFRKQLLIDLQDRGYEVIAMAPGRDQQTEKELSELGVEFIEVPLSRTGFNPLADIKSFLELKKLFKSIQPNLLITYTIKPNIYGTWACNGLATKKLAWITGLGFVGMPVKTLKASVVRKVIFALYKRSLRQLEYIAFQNGDDKMFFEKHGLLGEKTRQTITAGSGVSLTRFQKSGPVVDKIHFLLIARLIGAKGVAEYLLAAERLKKKYKEKVYFNLIGMTDPGNPDSISEERIKSLNSEGVIIYHGQQKDVRPLIASSSVFVLPSYYREGTPRTILEAMAMGKPIITTDNPGCRETVVEGENGYLIPVKNVEAMVTAMESFINKPLLIESMGEKSYEMAVNKYDVQVVNEHLLSFIEA